MGNCFLVAESLQFDEVYTPANRRRVLRVCRQILGNPHDAEDAAQDSFLDVLQNLSGYRGHGLTTWLCRIARNRAIKLRRERVEMVSLDTAEPESEPLIFALEAPGPSPEWRVFVLEVEQAIAELGPDLGVPLKLTALGCTAGEIGAVMGLLSAMAVKKRVQRAREQMRARFA